MHACENTGSPFRVLTDCRNGYIGVCTCCGDYNLAYKNVLLIFNEPQLFQFLDWLEENRSHPDFHVPLRHGRTHLYCGPVPHLFLAFNDRELDELNTMAIEVKLLLEARRAIAGRPDP
jgi:hypothetical protein